MIDDTYPSPRSRFWRLVAFLIFFLCLIAWVSFDYLLPAMRAVDTATEADRKRLSAEATLILALVLFVLAAALSLLFRFGRYFFPRPDARAKATDYSDAWTEAGRRAKPDEEPEEPDEQTR